MKFIERKYTLDFKAAHKMLKKKKVNNFDPDPQLNLGNIASLFLTYWFVRNNVGEMEYVTHILFTVPYLVCSIAQEIKPFQTEIGF